MARIPGAQDMGRAPVPRPSRAIASFNGGSVARGGQDLSQGISALADGLEDAGRATHAIKLKNRQEDESRENFETNRRFLEFSAMREDDRVKLQDGAKPGAFGLSDEARGNYHTSARKFLAEVPDRLKHQYDTKLTALEDRIVTEATNFERKARKGYYSSRVNEGLGLLEKNLYENPGKLLENFDEGRMYISSLPDGDITPIEKQAMVKAWKVKAQSAALHGMRPQERLSAIGRGAGTVKYNDDVKGQTGIRGVVANEAKAVGVPVAIALGIVSIESDFNPKAKAKTSSASGLYQFIKGTAAQYGLDKPFDAKRNAQAGARLLRDNIDSLKSSFPGREPSPGEIYLAHFSGVGTAKKLMRSDPNASASTVFPAQAIKANKSVLQGKTVSEVIAWANSKMATHMRKAGVEVAEIPPNQASPEYADLPLNVVNKLQNSAYAELNDEFREAVSLEKAQAVTEKARLSAYSESIGLRIETGDLTSRQAIVDDTNLDDGDKTRHLKALNTKLKQNDEVSRDATNIVSGKSSLNAYDGADRSRAKNAYEFLRKNLAEGENVAGFDEAFVRASNVVPQQVMANLLRSIESDKAEDVGDGFVRAQRIRDASPTGFRGIPSGSDVTRRLDQYEAFLSRGYSAEDAVSRVINVNNPEFKANSDAVLKASKKWISESATASSLASEFNPIGPFVGAPQIGAGPQQEAAIVGEYRSLLEDAVLEVGDRDAAQELAMKRFEKIYGVSSLNVQGERVLMRNPPERAYPAVDGGHEYITDALKSDLKKLGINSEKAYLISNSKTEQAIEAGMPPPYIVTYEDENGALQVLQEPFYLSGEEVAKLGKKDRQKRIDDLSNKNNEYDANALDMKNEEDAAKAAYDATVGPDWMKSKAADAAREKVKMSR